MKPMKMIASLDIGSFETRALVCRVAEERNPVELETLAASSARTRGVNRGLVVDAELLVDGIRSCVGEAERMAKTSVHGLCLGVSSDQLSSVVSRGVAAVQGEEVAALDVENALRTARAAPAPAGRDLLHAIPQGFAVDYAGGILNPVGMAGRRLETDLILIFCDAKRLGGLARAVERAGYTVAGRVLTSLASGRAVANEMDRELGVVTMDIGHAFTGLTSWYAGVVQEATVLRDGLQRIIKDVMRSLSISWEDAHALVIGHGGVGPRERASEETVEIPDGDYARVETRAYLAELLERGLERIFRWARMQLADVPFDVQEGGGVLLTGGGARIPGIATFARSALDLPVRLAKPPASPAGLDAQCDPFAFTAAAGLAVHELDRYIRTGQGAATVAQGFVGRVRAWLEEFF